jgi:hypothetical protein
VDGIFAKLCFEEKQKPRKTGCGIGSVVGMGTFEAM